MPAWMCGSAYTQFQPSNWLCGKSLARIREEHAKAEPVSRALFPVFAAVQPPTGALPTLAISACNHWTSYWQL